MWNSDLVFKKPTENLFPEMCLVKSCALWMPFAARDKLKVLIEVFFNVNWVISTVISRVIHNKNYQKSCAWS